jgi:type IV secretory pathway TraG/TraD family ATPase VirD4
VLSFLMESLGALMRRAWVRWLVQNWGDVLAWWAYASLAIFGCLSFYGTILFKASPYQPYGIMELLFFWFRGSGGLGDFFFAFVGLATIAALAPLALVVVPLCIVALPFVVFGLALWFFVILLASLGFLSASPFIIASTGRAVFIKAAAWWLASTDKREQEETAVFAALGLTDAPQRRLGGAARVMDSEEFQTFQKAPQRGARVILGTVGGDAFAYATEKHVLVCASTRGGKGRDLIIPNLLAYPGSVFVLDPKGENAQATHEARQAFGAVKVLDPFGVSGLPSARFNPLSRLKGVTDAQMMAEALIEGKDDHWTSSARGLLTGLLLHVATSPGLSSRDLPTVRSLLMGALPETLEAMTQNQTAPQEVRDVGAWGMGTAENEWSSIVSTTIDQTKWLASPEIQRVLRDGGDQVDFAAYRRGVQSVFVCLPAPYFRTFSKWLRLVVAAALDTLTKELNPEMPHPTRFVLDEVAQLGTLEKVESALTLSAGYGVQLWGIWQHLGDIARCYPRSGVAGWVSSSGLRLVFATQDNESVKYFAGMSGGAVTETDIRHMAPNQMLCLLDGQNPILVNRVAWVRPAPATAKSDKETAWGFVLPKDSAKEPA